MGDEIAAVVNIGQFNLPMVVIARSFNEADARSIVFICHRHEGVAARIVFQEAAVVGTLQIAVALALSVSDKHPQLAQVFLLIRFQRDGVSILHVVGIAVAIAVAISSADAIEVIVHTTCRRNGKFWPDDIRAQVNHRIAGAGCRPAKNAFRADAEGLLVIGRTEVVTHVVVVLVVVHIIHKRIGISFLVADTELLIFFVVGEIEACTVADMLPFNHPLVETCILVRREDTTRFYARIFGLVIVHNEGTLTHSRKDEVVTGGVGRDVDKGHTGIFPDLFCTSNEIITIRWTNEVMIRAIIERPKPVKRCVWLVGHIADFVKAVVIQCRVDLVPITV